MNALVSNSAIVTSSTSLPKPAFRSSLTSLSVLPDLFINCFTRLLNLLFTTPLAVSVRRFMNKTYLSCCNADNSFAPNSFNKMLSEVSLFSFGKTVKMLCIFCICFSLICPPCCLGCSCVSSVSGKSSPAYMYNPNPNIARFFAKQRIIVLLMSNIVAASTVNPFLYLVS